MLNIFSHLTGVQHVVKHSFVHRGVVEIIQNLKHKYLQFRIFQYFIVSKPSVFDLYRSCGCIGCEPSEIPPVWSTHIADTESEDS